MLDLTDWSLFFSRRDGYHFADVYKAPADRGCGGSSSAGPTSSGHWHYSKIIRELLSGREPVAQLPAQAAPGELQISIYDRQSPAPLAAAAEIRCRANESKSGARIRSTTPIDDNGFEA